MPHYYSVLVLTAVLLVPLPILINHYRKDFQEYLLYYYHPPHNEKGRH